MKKLASNFFERTFKLKSRSTTVSTEILAGFTTFAAMSYIMAVNPAILGLAGMDKPAVVTVTALAAAFGCFAMALLTNLPIVWLRQWELTLTLPSLYASAWDWIGARLWLQHSTMEYFFL